MAEFKPLPVIQPQPDLPDPPESSRTAAIEHDPAKAEALEPAVIAALKTVFDPEIPVNIYDLGLIYDVLISRDAVVGVRMTLTAPACPAAQWLPGQVEAAVKGVDGVADAVVDVVFDPPWSKERMSDAARLQLGLW